MSPREYRITAPNAMRGVGRLLDVTGRSATYYNLLRGPEVSRRGIAADWKAVAAHLREALDTVGEDVAATDQS